MKLFDAVTDLIQARMYMCLLGVLIVVVGMLSPSLAMQCIQKGADR